MGNNNIGIGFCALFNNTSGLRNNAQGYQALFCNTTGVDNTALPLHLAFNHFGADVEAFRTAQTRIGLLHFGHQLG